MRNLFFWVCFLCVSLSFVQADSREVQQGRLQKLRVLSNNNLPEKVIVVSAGNTREFVWSLIDIIQKINKAHRSHPIKVHVVTDSKSSYNSIKAELERKGLYETLVELNDSFFTYDQWMQDWGEVAAATVEGQTDEQMIILDSNRGRGLSGLPKLLADMWNMHYVKNPSSAGIKGDYGGNIEVTPDNLLVIGNTSTSQMRSLLFGLGYQDKHVILDTDWLQVGHVDEYISFVPNFKSQGGYTIVKSDPGLALDLIRDSSSDEIAQVNSRYRSSISRIKDVLLSENSLLRNQAELDNYDLTEGNMLEDEPMMRIGGEDRTAQLVDLNRRIAALIDRNVEALKARIVEFTGGKHHDISVISYPTIFQGQVSGGRLYNCLALLPGSVNMLVLRSNAVVPNAQLPLFNQSIRRASEKVGMAVHFIDTMPYHTLAGQIHCGTNVIRTPNAYHVYPDFIVRKLQFQDFFRLDRE